MRLFLGGDVMLGRALDALMPHASESELLQGSESSPADHLALIEKAYGRRKLPDPSALWGDLLPELARQQPDVTLVNLEVAVTTNEDLAPAKRFVFRMHPLNLPFLEAIRPSVCSIANNHTMDWGIGGLRETVRVLEGASIRTAGAGENIREAQRPAILQVPGGPRILVFAFTSLFAGSPVSWAAGSEKPGQWLLPAFTPAATREVLDVIGEHRRPDDIVIVSAHWGGNWGVAVDPDLREFCHRLIDGGVDVIHGHSSHHVKPLEVYKGHLILYGCGDLMNDYCLELVNGRRLSYRLERYRPDLELAYFADLTDEGSLEKLTLIPLRLAALHLQRANKEEANWLAKTVSFGLPSIVNASDTSITLSIDAAPLRT